jgi:hypothetical protein
VVNVYWTKAGAALEDMTDIELMDELSHWNDELSFYSRVVREFSAEGASEQMSRAYQFVQWTSMEIARRRG